MSGIYSALGRIGRNAEVRQTQGGTSVAGFPVAVDVGYGDNKTTLWLDASIWGKRAESGLIQYLVKGQQVWVAGEIGTREFQKRDGAPGFAVTLKVQEISLAGSPQGQQQNGGYASGQPRQQGGNYGQPQGGQQQGAPAGQPGNPGGQYPQGGAMGGQQQSGNFGAPDPGSFDDFDDEIPF
ncbi:single-stranded DNA-binding protein [Halomonas koreensis]|uniref:Single-stranded DNA-binding protein n=1 Tax=Halomonas koreensis TaxID=245385 RepID=A0ABU1G659_9GAMM|nr:single-stranded DNA-binding protein [Halomonas koreensis]MDR5867972.1 single-stranded DNA-binding protein [Halomonas koreensis]